MDGAEYTSVWGTALTLTLTAVTLLTVYLYWTLRRPAGFPPGPPVVPILGSFPFMDVPSPTADQSPNLFAAFSRLANKYGPVYSMAFGHKWIVMLNDYKSMREAMVQRGIDFAGRAMQELVKYENPYYPLGGLTGEYSDQWRLQRATSLHVLRNLGYGRGVTQRVIIDEAEIMTETFRAKTTGSIDIQDRISHAVFNVISSLLFGNRFDYDAVEYAELRKAVDDSFTAFELALQYEVFPCAFLIPAYRRHIQTLKDADTLLIEFIKKRIAEVPVDVDLHEASNFIEGYRMERQKNPQIANRLHQNLNDFIQAGLETTTTTLGWSVYFMMAYPEVQRKVHEELDGVVGRNRTPVLGDREKLPYVEATLLETLRLSRTAPVTLPHKTLQDTTVGGFMIPKGIEVWGNLWHILTDPEIWPEPEVFKPERFLGSAGEVIQSEHLVAFGLGRRACLGEQLAKQELFLFFTHLLHAFDISIADGEKLPDPVGRMALTYHPPEFNVNLTCRG